MPCAAVNVNAACSCKCRFCAVADAALVSCAARSIAHTCCQVWCSSCLLLQVVSVLPNTPVCSECGGHVGPWRVRVQDNDRDGSVRERRGEVKRQPRVGRKILRWLRSPAAQRRGDMALQVWVHPAVADVGDMPVTFQSIIQDEMPMGEFMGDADRSRALVVLLHHLHCRIFGGRRAPSSTSLECRTLAEFEATAQSASGPLTRILRLLGTGRPDRPPSEDMRRNYMLRKDVSVVQVCVDLLHKINSNDFVGATQDLVGCVARLNDQSHRQRTLSALGLAATGERINRELASRLSAEYESRPRNKSASGDTGWEAGDNFGFKQLAGGDADGGGSGYDAWFCPVKYRISRQELQMLAGPGKNLLDPRCHQRTSPSALGQDVRRIFAVSPEDGDYMRRRRLETHRWAIQVAVELEKLGGLHAGLKKVAGRLHVPAHWSTPYVADGPPVRRLRTPKGAKPPWASHLDAEGAQTDFACHVDPAKNETLEHLLKRQAEAAEGEIRRHGGGAPNDARGLDEHGNIKFPAAWMRLYCETDGKPARQIQNMQERRARDEGKYEALHKSELIEGILQFPGGFHIYKAALADVGVHGDCVSGPLAWLFLGSEGRVAYFQDPSDPRVPLLRWRQVLMATEVEIFYWASKDRNKDLQPAQKKPASPEEMEAYIKKVRFRVASVRVTMCARERAATVYGARVAPLTCSGALRQVTAACPAADAWWHTIIDLHTVFAIIDTETAGDFGDFAT